MTDPRERLPFSVWWLVVAGAVVMAVAGSYQFLWSSLRDPLGIRVGASETALGTVFTLFIVFQTVSQFPFGWVRDRYGPRWPLLAGAVFLTAGFALAALTSSLPLAALGFCLGGVGSGAGYTVAINTPVKWLEGRRGFATGVISMAYSAGSFLLIPFVRRGVQADFRATLLALAAVGGVAVFATVPVLRDPERATDVEVGDGATEAPDGHGATEGLDGDGASGVEDGDRTDLTDTVDPPDGERSDGERPDGGEPTGERDGSPAGSRPIERTYTWREMVRTWQFWLLYGVFTLANVVSLMVIGKAVSFAQHLGLSAAVATGSATLIALGDAAGIIAGGTISDRVGRERTVGLALVCFGLSLGLAVAAGSLGVDVAFVGLIAAAIFFRSPMFAVFPPLVGEYYGRTHSSTNYALVFTGKLWGGVGAGVLASLLVAAVGWNPTFLGGAAMAVVAGIATLFLRPVDQ